MSRPRLLLADDHTMFVEGLTRLLESEFDIVGTVSNGETLLATAKELRPDVVVADISMPGLNGIEATRQMLEDDPSTKIVLLTMHEDVSYAMAALDAGVHGYVLKNSEPAELLTAIREALGGRTFVTPSVASEIFAARRRSTGSEEPQLTPRQREILRLLCEGLAAKEIGAKLGLSRKTVEYHKYRVMDMLGLRTTAELIQYALKTGIAAM